MSVPNCLVLLWLFAQSDSEVMTCATMMIGKKRILVEVSIFIFWNGIGRIASRKEKSNVKNRSTELVTRMNQNFDVLRAKRACLVYR